MKSFPVFCAIRPESRRCNCIVSTQDNDRNSIRITPKPVAFTVKQGKAKVGQSAKAVTLIKTDRFSEGVVNLTLADPTLEGIDHVEIVSPKDKKTKTELFDLRRLSESSYAIGFNDDTVTSVKASNVKLKVFLKGNLTNKPNATLKVKVNVK